MPDVTISAPSVPAATPASAPGLPDKVSANPPAATVTTATVDVDAEEVGKWAKLSRAAREAKARNAELEKQVAELSGHKPAAEKAGTVERLIGEGKLIEALEAAGVDIEKAFAQWVEKGEGAPASAGPPKELIELQAKYDAIEKRLKDEDDKTAKDDEAAKAQAIEEGRTSTIKGIADTIATDTARWARCAKDPAEASADAFSIAVEKVKALGRAVTDAEAKELFEKSLDQAEAGYKALAEKFYVPETTPVRSRWRPAAATVAPSGDAVPARDSSPVAERKVAVTLDGQRGSLKTPSTESRGKLTEAEAKAKALESIRAMKRGK